jgi:hypothetical protein
MAKSTGILKIEGTVEDLTFYKKDGVSYVRRKGGVSKERIATDPNFVRTRENGTEFGHSANAGKILRLAASTMVFRAKDSQLSSRLLRVMSQIKNLDSTSSRGLRNVAIGIGTAEGKLALKGFDFNANAPLKSVLFAPYLLDTATGIVKFTDLIPGEQVHFPQGATHFSLQCAYLVVNFATGVSEIGYSAIVNLKLNFEVSNPELKPVPVPVLVGTKLYLLMVSFYQEVNGVQYSLKNEEYNVLHVMEVL